MAFPVLEEYGFWKPSSREIFDVGPTEDLDIGNFSDQLQNSSKAGNRAFTVRIRWITQPKQFGTTSGGLLVATSSKLENTTTFNLGIACSIDARWALGTTSMSGTRSGWAFAGCGKPTVSEISNKRASTNDYGGIRHFLPVDDGSRRRIAITHPWLQSITPPVPGSTSTTLETILEDTIPMNINLNNIQLNTLTSCFTNTSISLVPIAEHIISVLVTDGISRVGSVLQPNTFTINTAMFGGIAVSEFSRGQPTPAPRQREDDTGSPPHYGRRVRVRFVGRTRTFAIIVIDVHMAIALLHVVRVVFR